MMNSEILKPQLLEYALGPELRAFSTERMGGVSQGHYASFNINRYCGDEESAVAENRSLLCRELGVDDKHLILPHQTHSTCVHVIDEAFLSLSPVERQTMLEGVDGLITALPGVCVGVSTADCVPVLLADAANGVIAAVHAGWRGTLGGIAGVAVHTLCQKFGLKPAHLKAVIGPSISLPAFEVGHEVYDAFEATDRFPMSQIARRYPARGGGEKWHIDLWAANFITLEQCGVLMENIQVAGVCTYSQYDRFFSARRLGIHSGRIFTGIIRKHA